MLDWIKSLFYKKQVVKVGYIEINGISVFGFSHENLEAYKVDVFSVKGREFQQLTLYYYGGTVVKKNMCMDKENLEKLTKGLRDSLAPINKPLENEG